ncbi:MAG: SIS domain-containing protein [Gammaproteobacteria bacterium]|nr:SIS domain-containing protein [Gammaproteobacteria bacterium]
MDNMIHAQITESVDVFTAIQNDNHLIAVVKNVVDVCVSALNNKCKLLFMGNGGSAADCQHLAGEMVSRLSFDRPGLPAFALTVDSSVMTAIANDYGYDCLFSRQVEAVARPGDVLFGISTSGCSPNVLAGLTVARKMGVTTVGMTGNQKADIVQASDYVIEIPSASTPKIQEGHILIGHIICNLIEKRLFEHLK